MARKKLRAGSFVSRAEALGLPVLHLCPRRCFDLFERRDQAFKLRSNKPIGDVDYSLVA